MWYGRHETCLEIDPWHACTGCLTHTSHQKTQNINTQNAFAGHRLYIYGLRSEVPPAFPKSLARIQLRELLPTRGSGVCNARTPYHITPRHVVPPLSLFKALRLKCHTHTHTHTHHRVRGVFAHLHGVVWLASVNVLLSTRADVIVCWQGTRGHRGKMLMSLLSTHDTETLC